MPRSRDAGARRNGAAGHRRSKCSAPVDTMATDSRLAAQSILDFDPAKDGVFERQMVESLRDQLRTALARLELREEEVKS